MKKMLAFFTAAMCCFGMFVSCGRQENDDTEKSAASESSAAPATEVKEESQNENSGEEYVDVFRTFFIGGAPDKMLEASLPDVVTESMKNIGGTDIISETVASSVAQSMSAVPVMDAETIGYISERECTPEFRSKLEKLYSAYYGVYKAMDDNGISYNDYIAGKVDGNHMNILSEALGRYGSICAGEETDVELTIRFEDVRLVTFSMGGESAEFLMYKIKGENWKLDTIGLAVFEY